MSKEKGNVDEGNVEELNFSTFDYEEVPYLNNEGDGIQDILKEVQKNTEDIEAKIDRENNSNVLNVNFKK